MIQNADNLEVADNSGARCVQCKVLGVQAVRLPVLVTSSSFL